MRRIAAVAIVVAALAATGAPAAGAVKPRASLTNIENDVMCVVCNTPLAVSQSPQADAERQFISGLIAQGKTKKQIENALVAQYGSSVLALPPAHGFNLTVYVLPPRSCSWAPRGSCGRSPDGDAGRVPRRRKPLRLHR